MGQEQTHTGQACKGNSPSGSQGLGAFLNMIQEATLKDENGDLEL